MKKLIMMFLAVGLAFAFTTNAKAQTDVTITATVLQAIDINVTSNISFGNVEANSEAEIRANGNDGTTSSNASDPTPGVVSITGGGQDYIITQNAAGVLALDGNDAVTLAFTPRYFDGVNNITDAITDIGYTVEGGGSITLEIGGRLASPSTTGSYSTGNVGGTHLQIEVAYAGL